MADILVLVVEEVVLSCPVASLISCGWLKPIILFLFNYKAGINSSADWKLEIIASGVTISFIKIA